MAKQTKQARKFRSSGELKRKIETRQKYQKIKKRITASRGKKSKGKPNLSDERGKPMKPVKETLAEESDEFEDDVPTNRFQGMSVDDFLQGDFMEEDNSQDDGDEDLEQDELGGSDNESFSSVDDLQDEAEDHLMDLKALADNDPEFYKYLQENDQELLNFDASAPLDESTDGEESAGMILDGDEVGTKEKSGDDDVPHLTSDILKQWQKGLLEYRSLRALRKLLLAFRSAANMNDSEPTKTGWTIDDPAVFNKLIVTSFKYTPVVLNHHIPYKTLPNGKFKAPAQSTKQKSLGKLVLSYFFNVLHLISQLSDPDMLTMAVSESSKIIPYVTTSRKAVKQYIKGIYPAFVRASKATTVHTIPSINLMKNSASDIYCIDQAMSYQHGFGYIRQLAVHLRNSMKLKSTEAYRQVYNWQFVHSVDFWSLVLAKACTQELHNTDESELRPLIYPLVQITVGAVRLIPTARYYPLHLHLIRSLLQLMRHTKTYIPLAPFILPIITGPISPTTKSKPSTLRPLDITIHIRAPTQYLGTKVYNESIVEESTFVLAEWCETLQGSIAFPEIMVPILMVLKRAVKKSKGGKISGCVKALIEKIEDGVRWAENQRSNVGFAPGMDKEVKEWEAKVTLGEAPIGKWTGLQRKARERKRELLEKVSNLYLPPPQGGYRMAGGTSKLTKFYCFGIIHIIQLRREKRRMLLYRNETIWEQ
ncbi:Nucleolar Complex 2 protein [Tulasnella sp. 419]|nr:Nucleolar Complex 2 protein [Tulasnella sp. 419]